MSYNQSLAKQNVKDFNSFLSIHLVSQKEVLKECLFSNPKESSLADFLFVELSKQFKLPRCSSLTDVLKIKPKKISNAHNKKFKLDVDEMLTALADHLNLNLENSPSQENSSADSSISSDDTSEYVRRSDESLRDVSNQVASQSDNSTTSRSVSRHANRSTSLASGLVQSGDMYNRGVWIPQNDETLLDRGCWTNAEIPTAMTADEDGRPLCDEGMWYVFDRDLHEASKIQGNELTKITKNVFGGMDKDEHWSSSHTMKAAKKQLSKLVARAKLVYKSTIEARTRNHGGSSIDEGRYVKARVQSQIDAEVRVTNYRMNKKDQNKRHKDKLKKEEEAKKRRLEQLERQLIEKDRLLGQLKEELKEKDLIIAQKTKCIEEKNEEIESLRSHDDDESTNETPPSSKKARTTRPKSTRGNCK